MRAREWIETRRMLNNLVREARDLERQIDLDASRAATALISG